MAVWTPPLSPLPPVASKYNLKRVHPMYGTVIPHTGVDYTAPAGTPVYAVSDGIVERSAFDAPRWQGGTGAGNHIRINHGSGVTSRYYHLSVRYLAQGERVKAGQRIGLVGATGDATGPHLHFEIRIDGTAIEPTAYLNARLTGGTVMSWTDTTGTTNPVTGKPVTKAEALQIAQHYAFRAWQLGIEQRTQTAALSAAVKALGEDPELDADALALEVSAAMAPMLTDTIVDAIAAAGVLTPEQARDAAETAIREVLGSLGTRS